MHKETASAANKVSIYDNRALLGAAAARAVAGTIRLLLKEQEAVNIVFAAAPSQNEFLAALINEEVNWSRINCFHMDEYIGLDKDSSQTFASYLKNHLFGKISCRSVNYLNGNAANPVSECKRYTALLEQFPIDIVCMGIGENNHIAFNDPPVADFNDRETVKIVTLDKDCRQQQVNDGCFPSLEIVPTQALTLTVPTLLHCQYIFCMVPGERKAKAVFHTLNSPVTELYPSTILTTHPDMRLYLDKDSSQLVKW
jgi:glucosamine-6-phosphate deaminase